MTLAEYIREAWHVLEPGTTYVHGRVIDAISEHLEAVTYGRFLDMGLLNRLLITVPPGMSKSLLVSVFWPSFEWGPAGMPWLTYLSTSHSDDIAARDARKMRDLIESEWWQERWGRGTKSDVWLTRRGETDFANNHRGWRKCVAFSALTGNRADRVLVDDPLSTEKAETELDRLRASRIFHESLHSRINDPKRSAIVIIMQRLHKMDTAGLALASPQGYIHLMLPMLYEADRRCVNPIFQDWRQHENDLLFPERFPQEFVDRERTTMGNYAYAGQYQQRPDLREGNMFKRHWWKLAGAAPAGIRWVRYWDIAATDEKYSQSTTARTAGLLMGGSPSQGFYIADCIAERVENPDPLIRNTGSIDRTRYFPYEIGAPQDPGATGKIYKKFLVGALADFNVRFLKESSIGSKPQRAEPLASQAEAGNVYLVCNQNEPLPKWAEDFIAEAAEFPGGPLKDRVDAASGAYATLLKPPRIQQGGGRTVPAALAVQVIGR